MNPIHSIIIQPGQVYHVASGSVTGEPRQPPQMMTSTAPSQVLHQNVSILRQASSVAKSPAYTTFCKNFPCVAQLISDLCNTNLPKRLLAATAGILLQVIGKPLCLLLAFAGGVVGSMALMFELRFYLFYSSSMDIDKLYKKTIDFCTAPSAGLNYLSGFLFDYAGNKTDKHWEKALNDIDTGIKVVGGGAGAILGILPGLASPIAKGAVTAGKALGNSGVGPEVAGAILKFLGGCLSCLGKILD
jgi:hypothetical protein